MDIQELRRVGRPFVNTLISNLNLFAGTINSPIGGENISFINGARYMCIDYAKLSIHFIDSVTGGCLSQAFECHLELNLLPPERYLIDAPGVIFGGVQPPCFNFVVNNGQMVDEVWMNSLFENIGTVNNAFLTSGELSFLAALGNITNCTLNLTFQGYYLI